MANQISKIQKVYKTFLILFTLLIVMVLSIPFYVRLSVNDRVLTVGDSIPSKNFAIVLGAGIKQDGKPGNYLIERLDNVIYLLQKQKIKKILLTGNTNEISVMYRYLRGKGVPHKIVFADYAGFDTYSSIERASKIFQIKDAIIVSQGFHLPRSIYMAGKKGIDAVGYSPVLLRGNRRYFIREWGATIKSYFDCLIKREAKFYGQTVNTDGFSNINESDLDK